MSAQAFSSLISKNILPASKIRSMPDGCLLSVDCLYSAFKLPSGLNLIPLFDFVDHVNHGDRNQDREARGWFSRVHW